MTLDSRTRIALQKHGGHKYDHGHALIVAGGAGHGGAARLAARAALRIGAGLATLGPPTEAMAEHAGPPDALMRHPIDTSADLTAALAGRRINAVCLGPGCGVDRAGALLPQALASGLPCLLDADALTALAQAPQPLRDNVALTPHMGEFARLFPEIAASLGDDPQARLNAAKQAAQRVGAVVLLKGPDTAIAAPDGRAFLHSAPDVPWLATAGSGDVLAGLITGLLARGFAPLDGAWMAAHIHAAAARRFGPGLIADDLVDQIPAILREMA